MSLRDIIARGLQTTDASFSKSTVDDLERRVQKARPEHPKQYAFIASKNYAIDAARSQKYQSRLVARQKEAMRIDCEQQKLFVRCSLDFMQILFRLLPELPNTQRTWLRIVHLSCFELLGDAAYADQFPGSNREQRYQWKHRGIRLLRPHASEELNVFLQRRGGRKGSIQE